MDPGGRRAAVAGHSGLVGRALLERLLDCAQYHQIHCIGRRPPARQDARIMFHPHDLKTVPALPPLDDAFCCLGTTIAKAGSKEAFREVDDAMVRRFAQAAMAGGARKFMFVSALGANAHSRVFYSRVKGEIEAALAEMGFEALHLVRPSFLVGERAEHRLGERIGIGLFGRLAPVMVGPARKYRPVAADRVAAAMVRLALSAQRGVRVWESDTL